MLGTEWKDDILCKGQIGTSVEHMRSFDNIVII